MGQKDFFKLLLTNNERSQPSLIKRSFFSAILQLSENFLSQSSNQLLFFWWLKKFFRHIQTSTCKSCNRFLFSNIFHWSCRGLDCSVNNCVAKWSWLFPKWMETQISAINRVIQRSSVQYQKAINNHYYQVDQMWFHWTQINKCRLTASVKNKVLNS